MAKITQDQKGGGRPQLKPKDCGGADLVVVTITAVEMKGSQFRKGEQPVLTVKEFPEHEYRCGKRSVDALTAKLGDETDDWVGERVPLVKRFEQMAKNQGGDGYVYQVPAADEWNALLKKARK